MPTTRRSFSQLPGRVADGSLEFMAGQVSKPIYKAAGISPGQNAASYTDGRYDVVRARWRRLGDGSSGLEP